MKIKGKLIFKWAKDLFPLHRSITGKGTEKTLSYLNNIIGNLKIHEIKSGSKIFDWRVPKVWEINKAYIKNQKGKKIVDYNLNNLHIVGYSIPFKGIISFDELNKHLYSVPNQKNAIPFITSYYRKNGDFVYLKMNEENLKERKI